MLFQSARVAILTVVAIWIPTHIWATIIKIEGKAGASNPDTAKPAVVTRGKTINTLEIFRYFPKTINTIIIKK